LVLNKFDLLTDKPQTHIEGSMQYVYVSAKTGTGLEDLRYKILKLVGWRDQESGAFMARERHLRALNQAKYHLESAHEVLSKAELFAEELRLAQLSLNEITGEFTSDDLLGEIFSRFCIGK
jgi:tRNA modification GTPase